MRDPRGISQLMRVCYAVGWGFFGFYNCIFVETLLYRAYFGFN